MGPRALGLISFLFFMDFRVPIFFEVYFMKRKMGTKWPPVQPYCTISWGSKAISKKLRFIWVSANFKRFLFFIFRLIFFQNLKVTKMLKNAFKKGFFLIQKNDIWKKNINDIWNEKWARNGLNSNQIAPSLGDPKLYTKNSDLYRFRWILTDFFLFSLFV